MNFPKGETRVELLNRAFIYGFAVTISVFLFIQVKGLIFDLFVAVVLAALAEPVVYRLSKKFSRDRCLGSCSVTPRRRRECRT